MFFPPSTGISSAEPLSDLTSLDRKRLRAVLRQRRRSLSPLQQQQAAWQLRRQLSLHPWFVSARRIAAYLPDDGEISPLPLMQLAKTRGKQVLLPMLHPLGARRLIFAPYQPERVQVSRLGVAEPVFRRMYRQACPVWALDLILLPLVGFDAQGQRLGRGGGFYDASLAPLRTCIRRPKLLGLAHDCQQVTRLLTASWDIPLDGIMTPSGLVAYKNS